MFAYQRLTVIFIHSFTCSIHTCLKSKTTSSWFGILRITESSVTRMFCSITTPSTVMFLCHVPGKSWKENVTPTINKLGHYNTFYSFKTVPAQQFVIKWQCVCLVEIYSYIIIMSHPAHHTGGDVLFFSPWYTFLSVCPSICPSRFRVRFVTF